MSDGPGADADRALATTGEELVAALERAVPGWAAGLVERRAAEAGRPIDEAVRSAARAAADAAGAEVLPALRRLLGSDVDEQRTNPLAILRDATRHPTAALVGLGIPAVTRDAFAERAFPHDPYDLVPASFADVHPDLQELGVRWGAAKAFAHLRRHGGGSSSRNTT